MSGGDARPDLIDLLGAISDYVIARNSEHEARSVYDGYSWDYFGSDYIARVERSYVRVDEEWAKIWDALSARTVVTVQS